MIVNVPDYIKLMEKENCFSSDAPLPDLNSTFWQNYYQELKSFTGFDAMDKQVHYLSCGLGFATGDFDDESTDLKFALYEAVSNPRLYFKDFDTLSMRLQDVKDQIGDLCTHQNTPIISETFMFSGQNEDQTQSLIWMNSPVAVMQSTFGDYIENLSADRRKQARRLMRQYDEDTNYRFDFSATPLSVAEMDFVVENSLKRWGADGQHYALAQTLWAQVAAKTVAGSAYFMRVYEGDHLLLIASYIKRGDVLTSQATCRDEDNLRSGLGTMVDFKTISLLHDSKLATILDPTCRTSLNDPENIGVAKREVVNTDMRKPILALAGVDMGDAFDYPYFSVQSGWKNNQELCALGRLK